MDTGPAPRSGYDLAISELHDDRRHEFVVEAGSERGAELLAAIGSRPATRSDLDAVAAVTAAASAHMGRELRPEDPPRAAEHPEHPRWDDVATRCLACGNCTMVCPTCFCGTTEDSMDLAGLDSERWRVWDSCFNLDFTHMQGGAVRSSVASRYRQWLLHKLVTWHDQFGSSGCVGCGRCITWCPVGIDLTEEIAALAAAPEGPTTDGGRS
jgi:ferredoxin